MEDRLCRVCAEPFTPSPSNVWLCSDNCKLARKRQHYRTQSRGTVAHGLGENPIGECPICLKENKLYWDHDHTTGAFRGWICNSCNRGLGLFGDKPEGLKRAWDYLVACEARLQAYSPDTPDATPGGNQG